MEQNYYQKEIETMPLEEMKKLQSEKLVKQLNPKIYKESKIFIFFRSSPRLISVTHIPTDFLQSLSANASEFTQHQARPVAALLLSILRMTLIFGKTAVQEQSLRQAAQRKTFVR